MKVSAGVERLESQVQSLQHDGKGGDDQIGASCFRTILNGLNTLSGIGILAIPYAFSEGGWLSLMTLIIISLLFWYTSLLLHRCLEFNSATNSFPDIGELAFGRKGRLVVSLSLILELYIVAVQFLIIGGDNLAKLFPHGIDGFVIGKLGHEGMFIVLTALAILPTTWLKNLKMLAYISFGGVFALVVILVSVFWVGAVDGQGFNEKGSFVHLKGTPNSISIFTFCYCGHSVIPTIYSSMKHKSKFPKVMLICFILATFIYGSMGVVGYLMYGEHVYSEVTLNLPTSKISSKIAICTALVKPLTKYALVVTPIAAPFEEKLRTHTFIGELASVVIIRTIVVFSSLIVALTVPFFGQVMAFGGALFGVTNSILLPCLCYLKINGKKTSQIERVIIVAILCIGVLVGVSGTYTSIKDISAKLKGGC